MSQVLCNVSFVTKRDHREEDVQGRMRIWHQSMTDLARLPGYFGILRDHAARVGSSGTVVDLHGLDSRTYPDGTAPVEMTRFSWLHHLAFVQIVRNAMEAEAAGYDAVAISCFVDPALDMARSAVDIPVVSSCEASLLAATAVGRSFALVTLDMSMVRVLRELVHRYGFTDRVVSISHFDPPLDEFVLDQAFAGSIELTNRFVTEARHAIALGADVIIPAEGVLNAVMVKNGIRDIDGVPVLDSYGTLLGFAELYVHLQRVTGLKTSRAGVFARPGSEITTHVEALTAQILGEREMVKVTPSDRPAKMQVFT